MASKSQSARTARPASGGSGRRRPPPPPVSKPKPWGLIAGALALVLFIGGLLAYAVTNAGSESAGGQIRAVQEQLEGEGGVQAVDDLSRDHVEGPVDYDMTPPLGGDHASIWQTCQGIVYTEPIASENAVHSLEHGAVWIAYRDDLPEDQVESLAGRVQGRDYMFMSPFPELESPVVLSAWGRQLAVDSADDPRVDQFIEAYRLTRSQEPGATCGGGTTAQGVTDPAAPAGAGMPQGS